MDPYDRGMLRKTLALSFFLYAFMALTRALSPVSTAAEDIFGVSAFFLTAAVGGCWMAAALVLIGSIPRVERFLTGIECASDLPFVGWTLVLLVPFVALLAITFVAVLAPLCAPPFAAEFCVAALSAWLGAIQLRAFFRERREARVLSACLEESRC